MRQLEHQITKGRAALRRTWARFATANPDLSAPARLVLRLDDTDLPGSLGSGKAMSSADWGRVIAQTVEWVGPVPVTVLAHHAADRFELPAVIRFAHRLECPTLLVADGSGIDRARAEALIDVGLSAARIVVGGVSEEIHREVVGNSAREATAAVQHLIAARSARGARLDVEVALPWRGPATEEARAVVGWARQVGVDGLRIIAPFHATGLPADPELLDALMDEMGAFGRAALASIDEIHAMVARQDGQPGLSRKQGKALRRRWRCPVGGQRLVVTGHRQVYSCPFKPAVGEWDGELRRTWMTSREHLSAIAGCDRACAHVELAPEPIWG